MSLVLRRTALFVFIVLVWALIAAAVAHASARRMAGVPPSAAAVLR
jgi:hypothetical protein